MNIVRVAFTLAQAAQAETEAARRAAAAASEEGRARDSLVLANRQLESARHFERVAQVRAWAGWG